VRRGFAKNRIGIAGATAFERQSPERDQGVRGRH
jgi:hypothetical protein